MITSEIERLLHDVTDPEIPRVSIVDLGMVEEVVQDGQSIAVSLIPTFVGCPAQDVIRRAVKQRMEEAFPGFQVNVRFSLEAPWSTNRITPAGRKALRDSGIAPPGRDLDDVACPFCGHSDNVLQNLFASTSCRSLYYCRNCRNPFEAFKPM